MITWIWCGDAIKLMRDNLDSTNGDPVDLSKAIKYENRINSMRDNLKDAHYTRLESGSYSTKAGVFFLDFVTRLEKIGDHLFNVNEALAGKKMKTHTDLVVGR